MTACNALPDFPIQFSVTDQTNPIPSGGASPDSRNEPSQGVETKPIRDDIRGRLWCRVARSSVRAKLYFSQGLLPRRKSGPPAPAEAQGPSPAVNCLTPQNGAAQRK